MKNFRHQKGFSLAETLISLVILTLALLSLAVVPVVTTRALLLSDEHTKAAFMASSALEFGETVETYGTSPGTGSDFVKSKTSGAYLQRYVLSMDARNVYTVALDVTFDSSYAGAMSEAPPEKAVATVTWNKVVNQQNKPGVISLERVLGASSYLVVSDDQ